MNLAPLHSSARFGTTVQENLTVLIDLDYSALGPTPPEVSRAVRHVCGIPLPGDDLAPIDTDSFYETVQGYYAKLKRDDSSGRNARIFVCYFSSYYHELRHVHDLLASRTGQVLFYSAFRVILNTPGLLNSLWDWQTENPDGRIPLPLSEYADQMPGLASDASRVFAEWTKATEVFRNLQGAGEFSPGHLSIVHLLETSAVNTQLDFLHDCLGTEAVLDLTSMIEEEGNSSLYLQVRNEMAESFANAEYAGVGVGTLVNYVIWAALNQTAPLSDPGDLIPPVAYFEFLIEEVIRRIPAGTSIDLTDLRKAIDEACDDWRLVNLRAMRTRTESELMPRVQRIREGLEQIGDPQRSNVLSAVLAEYGKMHDLIEETPRFMGQREYVWAVLYGRLPSVHVKVFSGGVAHDVMSSGREGIGAEDWIGCATWGSTLRLLAEGMGKTRPEFYEQLCFKLLRQPEGNRPALRFFNPKLRSFAR